VAKINFTCPNCGGPFLVEAVLMREYWTITEVEEDYVIQESLIDSEGSDMAWPEYLCNACGFKVPADSPEELYEWLEEKEMLEFDEDE
jgi:hypothetical protein